jgi:hypothetical protein
MRKSTIKRKYRTVTGPKCSARGANKHGAKVEHIIFRDAVTTTTGALENQRLSPITNITTKLAGLITSDMTEVDWKSIRVKARIQAYSDAAFAMQLALGACLEGATFTAQGGLDIKDSSLVDGAYTTKPFEWVYVDERTIGRGDGSGNQMITKTVNLTPWVRKLMAKQSEETDAQVHLDLFCFTNQGAVKSVGITCFLDIYFVEVFDKAEIPLK